MPFDRSAKGEDRLRRMWQKLSMGNGPGFSIGHFLVYDAVTDTLSFQGPLTTKGDLFGRSSTDDARVPIGTNGQLLTADSTQALGLKWANAPATGTRVLYVNTADSANVDGATLGAGVFGDFSLNYVLPINQTVVGTALKVVGCFEATGIVANSTEIRLKAGATVLATTGSKTANGPVKKWTMEFIIVCRSAGGAGTWAVDNTYCMREGSGPALVVAPVPTNMFQIVSVVDTGATQQLNFDIAFTNGTNPPVAKQTLLLIQALN